MVDNSQVGNFKRPTNPAPSLVTGYDRARSRCVGSMLVGICSTLQQDYALVCTEYLDSGTNTELMTVVEFVSLGGMFIFTLYRYFVKTFMTTKGSCIHYILKGDRIIIILCQHKKCKRYSESSFQPMLFFKQETLLHTHQSDKHTSNSPFSLVKKNCSHILASIQSLVICRRAFPTALASQRSV
jgi:hypothetical protein